HGIDPSGDLIARASQSRADLERHPDVDRAVALAEPALDPGDPIPRLLTEVVDVRHPTVVLALLETVAVDGRRAVAEPLLASALVFAVPLAMKPEVLEPEAARLDVASRRVDVGVVGADRLEVEAVAELQELEPGVGLLLEVGRHVRLSERRADVAPLEEPRHADVLHVLRDADVERLLVDAGPIE